LLFAVLSLAVVAVVLGSLGRRRVHGRRSDRRRVGCVAG
jgi:hypothetical protein